jgi:hypothetical protein
MKPDAPTALRQLIDEVRQTLPFDLPEARVCNGPCDGCSLKLLDFLEMELAAWERRLDEGEKPGLAELSRLAKTARRIHRILHRNGLLDAAPQIRH